jgi:hypothetical protein
VNKCIKEKVTAIIFILIIFSVSIFKIIPTLKAVYGNLLTLNTVGMHQTIINFEQAYNTVLSNDQTWIDIYGLTNRVMLKRETGNFDVLKDNKGYLYLLTNKDSEETTKLNYESTKDIYDLAVKNNIPFLFLQVPYKNFCNKPELQSYAYDYTKDNFDAFLNLMEKDNMPYLDLEKIDNFDYYRTDHHWTVETSFNAAVETIKTLNDLYDFNLDPNHIFQDTNQYDKLIYENSFLGSSGIRVGKYYAGKDDFIVIKPKFSTNLQYWYKVDGNVTVEKSGDFMNALLDQKILNDKNYNNKYNAFLNNGYVENIVLNKLSENNLKVLFISHSFGRPMTQYLSLYFHEIRNLDPQDGRYNDSYLDYIKEYNPDIILVMYNGLINTKD